MLSDFPAWQGMFCCRRRIVQILQSKLILILSRPDRQTEVLPGNFDFRPLMLTTYYSLPSGVGLDFSLCVGNHLRTHSHMDTLTKRTKQNKNPSRSKTVLPDEEVDLQIRDPADRGDVRLELIQRQPALEFKKAVRAKNLAQRGQLPLDAGERGGFKNISKAKVVGRRRTEAQIFKGHFIL